MRRPSMRVDTGRATPGVRLSRGGQNGGATERWCPRSACGCDPRARGGVSAPCVVRRARTRRVSPGSEFEHGGVGLGDAFPPRSEVDEYRDFAVAFHADGPAEAVLVVSDAVADGEVLARCFDPGLEGAGGQDAADCCRFRHSLQYAPEIARAGPSGAFNFGARQECRVRCPAGPWMAPAGVAPRCSRPGQALRARVGRPLHPWSRRRRQGGRHAQRGCSPCVLMVPEPRDRRPGGRGLAEPGVKYPPVAGWGLLESF